MTTSVPEFNDGRKKTLFCQAVNLLELPELKLLVDAVESSHLITEKKSAALIEKLGHLTSRHNAALLNRPVCMDGTAKPDNETVYYAIDAIQRKKE